MAELRVLFCSPEVSPYAKTGGLADVAASLPGPLKGLGCDVRIFMPFYRSCRDAASVTSLAENIPIRVGTQTYHVHFRQAVTPSGVPVYFLEKDEFFDRTYLYGTPTRGDYEDNPERFITFCRAAHALCLQLNWFPDVFHLHDWQSAL
ncbi:MAG TPA: glycogen/starch synthase, partial [Syntrophobacteraceae bacterium]|nr:glycogen/starch synthase [Syntrophobacteraceae bacterium]